MTNLHPSAQPQLSTTSSAIAWAISDKLVDYDAAMQAMSNRARQIKAGDARELVWLLEHPPLYTAGTGAQPGDLLNPTQFPVFHVGRGGQYTYHGPGQRLIYLMLDMRRFNHDVRHLVKKLEAWIIATLEAFNVRGEVRDGRVGVWVRRPNLGAKREDKIAAIGLRISHGVTSHGISLNIDPDLSHYDGIVPCGLAGFGITSLTDLGLPVMQADVDMVLKCCFEDIFGSIETEKPPSMTPVTAV